jgi:hypothetical protein
VAADHRSIHPGLPGLPWWAAVVVAITATMVGVALDAGSGNKELTNSFGAMYVLGCVVAVLAVRQSAVFTAVIQPPLVLFCAVPGAYWLFHGPAFTDIKTILINCGYPLIERFPLMLFTSAGVLLIGLSRWYFETASSSQPKARAAAAADAERMPSVAEKLGTKFAAVLNRGPAHATGAAPSRRHRTVDRPDRTTARPRGSGSARRFAPTSSRHVRPEFNDAPDPEFERPRRRRPASARREEPPLRRRPRPPQDSTRRRQPARETRRSQPARKARHSQRGQEARRDPRLRPEPSEPPPRRRHATNSADGSSATHHPISRVRYRRQDPGDGEEFPEFGAQPRARSHGPRQGGADSWEYDI